MRKVWVVKNEPKSNACLLSAIPNLFKPWTASDAAVDFWAQKVLKIAILFLISITLLCWITHPLLYLSSWVRYPKEIYTYLDKSRHFWNRFSLVCAAGGRDVLESCVRVSFEMKEKGKSLLQHYSLGLSSSAVFLYIEILYYTIGPKVQFFAPFRIFSELNNVSDFDPEMSSLY